MMDEQEKYTITIVRNIGIPISFTVRRWKVMFFVGVFAVFAVLLVVGSVDYLFLLKESGELRRKLAETREKANLLNEQIAKLDHDRYWINAIEKTKAVSAVQNQIIEQPEFSTEGIWVTSKPTLSEEDFQEGKFVEIDTLTANVVGDELKLTVKILNTSNPPQVVGGYVCLTLMNADQSPPIYKLVTGGEIGDNGFPSSYKSGKLYYIKRRTSTKHMNFELTDVNEYYTDIMVFLYSYQGRLLTRSQYPLNKEIFLE